MRLTLRRVARAHARRRGRAVRSLCLASARSSSARTPRRSRWRRSGTRAWFVTAAERAASEAHRDAAARAWLARRARERPRGRVAGARGRPRHRAFRGAGAARDRRAEPACCWRSGIARIGRRRCRAGGGADARLGRRPASRCARDAAARRVCARDAATSALRSRISSARSRSHARSATSSSARTSASSSGGRCSRPASAEPRASIRACRSAFA